MGGIKKHLWKLLNLALKHRGLEIINSNLLHDWQKFHRTQPRYRQSKIPEDAAGYLQPDNPRLRELQDRYSAFDNRVTTPSVWNDEHVKSEEQQR